jgi:transcriptional regulator with XRE-family HTH domain
VRYGMSQAELARRIGISGTALNQIESGKTPDPGVSRIIGIASVLGVSTDSLLLGRKVEASKPTSTNNSAVRDDTVATPPRPTKRPRPRKAASVA